VGSEHALQDLSGASEAISGHAGLLTIQVRVFAAQNECGRVGYVLNRDAMRKALVFRICNRDIP
jgi:hypothetical protein